MLILCLDNLFFNKYSLVFIMTVNSSHIKIFISCLCFFQYLFWSLSFWACCLFIALKLILISLFSDFNIFCAAFLNTTAQPVRVCCDYRLLWENDNRGNCYKQIFGKSWKSYLIKWHFKMFEKLFNNRVEIIELIKEFLL